MLKLMELINSNANMHIYNKLKLVCHPVAAVQYTFTYKQYIEQNNRHKQYIEQHNSLNRNSAGCAPSLRGIYPGICFTTEEKARKKPY